MSITGTEIKKEVVIKDREGNVLATLSVDKFPLMVNVEGEKNTVMRITRKMKVILV